MRASNPATRASTCAQPRSSVRASSSAPPPSPLSPRIRARTRAAAAATNDEDAYNAAMIAYSATPYEYKHELGLYYHKIRPNLYVGTQPTKPSDIDRLADAEGVTCVFNTQQDKDMEYWKVDFASVKAHVASRKMRLERYPFADFDADSLRMGLPKAVAAMDALLSSGEVVYCHCTAGMGRSPGVAIAYMYWFLDEFSTLDEAYDALTSIRPCGPKKESIRGATCDVLASPEGAWPIKPLTRTLAPNEGAALTRAEKESIHRKLRRA